MMDSFRRQLIHRARDIQTTHSTSAPTAATALLRSSLCTQRYPRRQSWQWCRLAVPETLLRQRQRPLIATSRAVNLAPCAGYAASRSLHTRSESSPSHAPAPPNESPSGDVDGCVPAPQPATSLLAQLLARRSAEPVPSWVSHVPAHRVDVRQEVFHSDIGTAEESTGQLASAPSLLQSHSPEQRRRQASRSIPASPGHAFEAIAHTVPATSQSVLTPSPSRPFDSVSPLDTTGAPFLSGRHAPSHDASPSGTYVPLLYRQGVLSAESRVRLPPLPSWLHSSVTMMPCESDATTSLEKGQAESLLSPDDLVEGSSGVSASMETADGDDEIVAAPSTATEDALTSLSLEQSSVPHIRRSRTLILDPVAWLSQEADAPLMEPDLLQTHITPSAFAGMTALYHSWEQVTLDDARNEVESLARLSTHLAQLATVPTLDSTETHDVGGGEQDELCVPAQDSLHAANQTEKAEPEGEGKGKAETTVTSVAGVSMDALMASTLTAVRHGTMPQPSTDTVGNATLAAAPDAAVQSVRDTDALAHTVARPSSREPRLDTVGVAEPVLTERHASSSSSSSPRSTPTSPPPVMVYNVFTGRVAQSASAGIQSLALMGLGVDTETRQLTVQDANAVHIFAQELRAERISWPMSWSRGVLFRRVKALLANDAVIDPSSQLAALLAQQYVQLQRRQQDRGGVIGAASPPGGTSDPDSTSVPLPVQGDVTIGGASRASELLTLADLNAEQLEVISFVKQGYNTYIGGGAGTGKSVLLRVLRQELLKEGLAVAMTGTTGMAGWHVGGCTLHHCFGINLFGEFTRRRELAAYDVLVIDEVSMLSRQLFESLEYQLRRANGVDLPFGGVQVIVCGDFLQLGAIAAQPIVNSPVFRQNFAMLKLKTMIRQDQHTLFSKQLEVLRRGAIPEGLQNTVQFLTAEEVVLAKEEERKRAEAQLRQLRQVLTESPQTDTTQQGAASLLKQVENKEQALHHAQAVEQQSSNPMLATAERSSSSSESDSEKGETSVPLLAAPTPYVADAVNLLPTNAQVEERNQIELMKLTGDAVSFPALVMPPTTLGTWTPTCLLRITRNIGLSSEKVSAGFEKRLLSEVEKYLAQFFLATPTRHANAEGEDSESDVRLQRAAASWLSSLMTGSRNIVLYRLFTDAFVLRVRIPAEVAEMDAQAFVTHFQRLDDELLATQPGLGVRVREWLASADGLHTEQDESILAHYASRSPMSHGVQLKIGARVMLRTNLGPRHVNGSLGTVVGFRALSVHDLPRYLITSTQREEAVQAYADFLQLEHGMAQAVVPEVDFGDGHVEAVPPVAFYVGGHTNTHQYSAGIVAVPLTLAYAFTVHKVQGLTLVGRVHLELSRMWPCEHLLYVAMSRVRNPEQLSVSSFSPRLVQASPECVLFDDSVPGVASVKLLASFVPATWRRAPSRRKRVVRRRQLEAAQRKKKQKQHVGDALSSHGAHGAPKKRWTRADMDREIQAIQEELLSAHETSSVL